MEFCITNDNSQKSSIHTDRLSAMRAQPESDLPSRLVTSLAISLHPSFLWIFICSTGQFNRIMPSWIFFCPRYVSCVSRSWVVFYGGLSSTRGEMWMQIYVLNAKPQDPLCRASLCPSRGCRRPRPSICPSSYPLVDHDSGHVASLKWAWAPTTAAVEASSSADEEGGHARAMVATWL